MNRVKRVCRLLRVNYLVRRALAEHFGWWAVLTKLDISVRVTYPKNYDGKLRFNGQVVDPDHFYLKDDE